IRQTNNLLELQIAGLEKPFVADGGHDDQSAIGRLAEPQRQQKAVRPDQPSQPNPPDQTPRIPACPQGHKPMVLRTAKSGKKAGQQFWGCSAYPECKGVVNL